MISEASKVYSAESILIVTFLSSYIDVSAPFSDILIESDSPLFCSVVSVSLAHVITGVPTDNEATIHIANNFVFFFMFISP